MILALKACSSIPLTRWYKIASRTRYRSGRGRAQSTEERRARSVSSTGSPCPPCSPSRQHPTRRSCLHPDCPLIELNGVFFMYHKARGSTKSRRKPVGRPSLESVSSLASTLPPSCHPPVAHHSSRGRHRHRLRIPQDLYMEPGLHTTLPS
jgi:hypothetical protein